jgi:hypothetical protein
MPRLKVLMNSSLYKIEQAQTNLKLNRRCSSETKVNKDGHERLNSKVEQQEP